MLISNNVRYSSEKGTIEVSNSTQELFTSEVNTLEENIQSWVNRYQISPNEEIYNPCLGCSNFKKGGVCHCTLSTLFNTNY